MTIFAEGTRIRIDGVARVEDAEPLVAALQALPLRDVDLSGCTDLHAAVLQTLLVFRPAITGLEANPALADWLGPVWDAKSPMEANS